MYDNLVKRLNAYSAEHENHGGITAEAADAIEELTGFVQEAERDRDEYRERLDKANDAIEELQQTAKHYKGCSDDWYKEACDYKAMLPRWIPVTKRLPEDRSDVLAYLKYEVGGRIAAANYDKGMWQDCVMGGLYRTEEGVVTHWMPIPLPPEEENND